MHWKCKNVINNSAKVWTTKLTRVHVQCGKASPAPGKKGATPVATPKSTKKQVTKPEKVKADKTPVRGHKRKGEETAKKEADGTKEYRDYDSAKEVTTQPLRK